MAPRTVQQIFGLKPEELNALTVLSGLEGYRGGPNSPDVAAVAANALSRRLHGGWGGRDIRNIAKAPGQYVAVDKYSMQQLADPAFGARLLGSQEEFNRLRDIVNNPSLVGEQFRRSRGAQSFRGTAAYGNRKESDYMPVPGKSNFYFNPLGQSQYQQGLKLFGQSGQPQIASATPAAPLSASQPPAPVASVLSSVLGVDLGKSEEKKSLSQMFVQNAIQSLLPGMGIIPNLFGTAGVR